MVGAGDGAEDGQPEAVVVVHVGMVELEKSLTLLQNPPGRLGAQRPGTARVPSKSGSAWCPWNGKWHKR
jgi:hypothetical protein